MTIGVRDLRTVKTGPDCVDIRARACPQLPRVQSRAEPLGMEDHVLFPGRPQSQVGARKHGIARRSPAVLALRPEVLDRGLARRRVEGAPS